MAGPSDVEYFARLIEALDPWLDQVVIIVACPMLCTDEIVSVAQRLG